MINTPNINLKPDYTNMHHNLKLCTRVLKQTMKDYYVFLNES